MTGLQRPRKASHMLQFMDGILFLCFTIAGLYFLRFWRDTHDRLFLMFSLAFWIMALNRVLQTWLYLTSANFSEHQTLLYTIRLVAFSMILLAIIDKNRSAGRMSAPPATLIDDGSPTPPMQSGR